MLPNQDTIAAIATPAGSGGVGIIRISGARALHVLETVVGVPAAAVDDRRLRHGFAREGDELIDEVLFVAMRGPSSFTGEDTAEIHGHGGAANMARLLGCVLAAGARHAEAGEFTRRAFENGRLDLTRAEAIFDIVQASSQRALRVAQSQLRGELGERVGKLRAEAVLLLAETEAHIDFPEEDLDSAHLEALRAAFRDTAARCAELASTFRLGRAVSQGIEVALCGAVNAGKSSLFNALIGDERALVADEEGTTRDYVEARVVWDGIEVTLVDTAGLRSSAEASQVERRGMALGQRRAETTDLELVIVPAGQVAPELSARQLLVWSKVDVRPAGEGPATSARTGVGIDGLKRAVLQRVIGAERESEDGLVVTSERQHARLLRASDSLHRAAEAIGAMPPEVVAVELRDAANALAEITGEVVGEEMLDALFARFCIGK